MTGVATGRQAGPTPTGGARVPIRVTRPTGAPATTRSGPPPPPVPATRLEHVVERTADASPDATAVEHEGCPTMSRGGPGLAGELRSRGFVVHELDTEQLAKSGGGVRCTALTLDAPAPARPDTDREAA